MNKFPLNISRNLYVIISTYINDFTVLVVQERCLKNLQSLKSQALKLQFHCFDLNNDRIIKNIIFESIPLVLAFENMTFIYFVYFWN